MLTRLTRLGGPRHELLQYRAKTAAPAAHAHLRPLAGIVGAEMLSWLPRGACVVNAARGKHLDEAALLAALDSGTWPCA
jgi:glyoxylate/hydroxypyruvate reductase A